MSNNLTYSLHLNVISGDKSSIKIVDFLNEEKITNISLILDPSVPLNSFWKELSIILGKNFEIDLIHINQSLEPTYSYLESIRNQFSIDNECIIGIGGGSTMDVTKGIAGLIHNKEHSLKYRGFNLLTEKVLPIILIPTTAGSGSESTPFSVFIDEETGRKFGINSDSLFPALTILDPQFVKSCPESVTISSGMDALVHTVEAISSRKANMIAKMYGSYAYNLLIQNLEKCVSEPENTNARLNTLIGAHFAGIALMNSSGSVSGVMSYPLGTKFKVPHGLAGAFFLRHIIELNINKGYNGYNFLDNNLLREINRISDIFNIPKNLGFFGMQKSDIDEFMFQLDFLWSAIEQNPVHLTKSEIKQLLENLT